MRRHKRCTFSYTGNGATVRLQYVDGYLIDWPDGADRLEATFSDNRGPDGHGSFAFDTQLSARPVTISGYITARPADKHIALLRQAFAPGSAGRLTAKDTDEREWYLDCRVQSSPAIEGRETLPRFQVQLRADYPHWQSTEETEMQAPGSASEPQVLCAEAPVLFRAEIRAVSGSVTGVTLTDGISGSRLAFSGAIPIGKTLILAPDAEGVIRCTLDGESVIHYVSGDLRKIYPGPRSIYCESTDGAVSCKLIYREALSGV